MIRSLFAVALAVILGLTVAKFLEGAGAASFPPPPSVDLADPRSVAAGARLLPFGYKAILAAGWGVGAFAASGAALLLARRWRPIGYLAAATIFFNAFMTLIAQPLGLFMWPAAVFVTAAGGYLAARVLRARPDYPQTDKTAGLFS